jgi:hypothetical protein
MHAHNSFDRRFCTDVELLTDLRSTSSSKAGCFCQSSFFLSTALAVNVEHGRSTFVADGTGRAVIDKDSLPQCACGVERTLWLSKSSAVFLNQCRRLLSRGKDGWLCDAPWSLPFRRAGFGLSAARRRYAVCGGRFRGRAQHLETQSNCRHRCCVSACREQLFTRQSNLDYVLLALKVTEYSSISQVCG